LDQLAVKLSPQEGRGVIPEAVVERAMKVQEVILRAMAKRMTWWQAAEVIGISDRQMRRWRRRWEKFGYDGLLDWRRGRPSSRRVPLELAERVLALYREKYFDFNVRHFHEKLREQHGIRLSYTWVKLALQGAGLVKKAGRRGVHRRRRPRRPLSGMLLHLDGSSHAWFGDGRRSDLLVVLDDATSEIYYAQLVEQESTRTVLAALRAVVEKKGLFCALYSDRASHFFETPKAGAKIDPQRLTQVGRALQQLGIRMIPAYSPQARGRSERNFGTWQGRLPQELRLRGIHTLEAANGFLREEYVAEFNRRFAVAAAQPGSAFLPLQGQNLERVFALQHERVVNRDNTVEIAHRVLQIEKTPWRNTLAGCQVIVYEHLDGTLSVGYGPHLVGHFNPEGIPLPHITRRPKAVEKTGAAPPWKTLRVSHFPTATATTRPLS
ncbi:MAG TPA: ISNCY family transposase, partial [Terriglobales bacterium]|nr:ISNCY family transposase [Terriglobales bacterium]